MGGKLQITLNYCQDLGDYLAKNHPAVIDYRIIAKSLDARRTSSGRIPKYHYLLEVIERGGSFKERKETFPYLGPIKEKPIIIGMGPAGLFAALRLAEYGVPSLLLERGNEVEKRMLDIARHWRYGQLEPESNVCFGEGGAGLFSDGKLNTRIKSPFVQYVMNKFVEFGAPKEIAYLANPHLGSNKIRKLIGRITKFLKTKKCQMHYQSKVTALLYNGDKILGVETLEGKRFYSSCVILATGHSAREMYHFLHSNEIKMLPKDFALGIRIEHPRRLINQIQYGSLANEEQLGAGNYRLSLQNKTEERGIYSFCMCPGGYVLSSGSDADGLVTNGMSNYAHRSPWSNSAIVVSVKKGVDFSSENVLAGLKLQKKIEKLAHQKSLEHASGKEIPAQGLRGFLQCRDNYLPSKTSCPSGIFATKLEDILPPFVIDNLRTSMEHFNKKMKGFISPEALCLAPETRTSAPVTIVRDHNMESPSLKGLYPCGEGAGYAGGIVSAAVDGVKVAMKILQQEKDFA